MTQQLWVPPEARARADLLRWLTDAAAEQGHLPAVPAGTDNAAQLVLECGEWFDLAPAQPRRKAQPGFCFASCTQAALSNGMDLDYIEGYTVMGEHLVHHAWLAQDTWAIDPTVPWPPGAQPPLRGVRVPLECLALHWHNCGGASFLLDPHHDYPALRVPYVSWPDVLPLLLAALHAHHCQREVSLGHARVRPDGSIWHTEHLPPEEARAAPEVHKRRSRTQP